MLLRDVIDRKSSLVKKAWISLVESRTIADAAGLHATAPVEIADAQALGLDVRRSFCVENGVEWPANPPALADTPFASLPRPYALFLSRISWKKGIDRLIRAWKLVPDLPLVIGGNDEEGLVPELTALARSEGVADRVRFIGAVSDRDKWALYREARFTVLPSYSENFGNVIAEAMAMACPVVLTRAVGIAPLVEANDAGIVCGDEPHEIADAVNRLAHDPQLCVGLGARGRSFVARELSWPAIAAAMENVYLSIGAVRSTATFGDAAPGAQGA
jgi:glycosyltransferase involved in cell wall biosynthesis